MGRAEYFDPVSQSRKPIKSGSIVNNTGLEYTPEDVKAIDDDLGSHKVDYVHHAGYGNASGTNAKTITLNPVPTGYTDGMTIAFKNTTQNSGAVTLNVNGLGAKSVLKSNGSALTSGNLKANSVYTVRYNGVNFILQGEGGEYGTAQAGDVLAPKTIGTDNGLLTGTIPSKSAQTFAPSTSSRSIASGRYLTGTQTISPIVGTSVRGDVLSGKTFNSASAGINQSGTMPNNGARNGTITTQGGQIAIPAGYTSGGSIKAQFANLVAGNIKSGVNVGGVVGDVREGVILSAWPYTNTTGYNATGPSPFNEDSSKGQIISGNTPPENYFFFNKVGNFNMFSPDFIIPGSGTISYYLSGSVAYTSNIRLTVKIYKNSTVIKTGSQTDQWGVKLSDDISVEFGDILKCSFVITGNNPNGYSQQVRFGYRYKVSI